MSLIIASAVIMMDWKWSRMMEYAGGTSLAGAGNSVVELHSVYVLGTLIYFSLLRSKLTETTLINVFGD